MSRTALQVRTGLAADNPLGEGVFCCPRVLCRTDLPATTPWRHAPRDGTIRHWAMPGRAVSAAAGGIRGINESRFAGTPISWLRARHRRQPDSPIIVIRYRTLSDSRGMS